MAQPNDIQLARALVQDADMLFQGGSERPSDDEITRIRRFIQLAEGLFAGTAVESDRTEAHNALHPMTVNLYLS